MMAEGSTHSTIAAITSPAVPVVSESGKTGRVCIKCASVTLWLCCFSDPAQRNVLHNDLDDLLVNQFGRHYPPAGGTSGHCIGVVF